MSVGASTAHSSARATASAVLSYLPRYIVNYARQTPPTILPSSFDYWWPYPSWGATTAPVTNTSPAVKIDLPITAVIASPLAFPSGTSDATPNSLMVQITALPPASNNLSYPLHYGKVIQHKGFNVIYLAPLFAVLGVMFGCLSGWLCYRWFAKRRDHLRDYSLEPGPPYESVVDGHAHQHDMETASLFAVGTPSKHSVHGRTYNSRRNNIWNSRSLALSSDSREPGTSGELPTKIYPRPAIPFQNDGERDPFLASPPRAPSVRSSIVARRSLSQHSSANLRSPLSYLFSADHQSREDDAAYVAARHKSIRRGILERLTSGTSRQIDDVEYTTVPLDIVENPVTESPSSLRRSTRRSEVDSRSDSLWTQSKDFQDVRHPGHVQVGIPKKKRSVVKSVDDETQWIAGSGFRIVKEDPEANDMEYAATKMSTGRQDSLSSIPSIVTPVRHREETLLKEGWSTSPVRRSPLARIDSSVLPRSPPLLMSPPLASTLFFVSSTSASISNLMAIHENIVSSASFVLDPNTPVAKAGSKKTKKLKSPKQPPLMPFPSYTTSPSPRSGKKLVRPNKDLPTTPPRRRREVKRSSGKARNLSAPSSLQKIVPATHREGQRLDRRSGDTASRAALNKVTDIITQSYSERNVR